MPSLKAYPTQNPCISDFSWGASARAKMPITPQRPCPPAMAFVPSAKSPNGAPMLIVANEVSGTVAVLQPTH